MWKTQIAEKPSSYKFGDRVYTGFKLSWLQFNAKTKEVQENGGVMEYIGSAPDPQGQIYCSFMELKKEPGGCEFQEGNRYFVNNDVVFDFQVNRKPVKTGKIPDEIALGADTGDEKVTEEMLLI